jgi:hypothetical protein
MPSERSLNLSTIDIFDHSEQVMLENSPICCFFMIGMLDGKLSKLELAALSRVIEFAQGLSSADDELYAAIMTRISGNVEAVANRVGQLPGGLGNSTQYLAQVASVLEKAPRGQAKRFKDHLVGNTSWIAQNSKMFGHRLTAAEASVVSNISMALGLDPQTV